MAIEAARLMVRVGADTSQAEQGISSFRGKLDNAAASMGKAGMTLSAGVTAPLLGAAGAALKFSTDLNSAMANVASLGIANDRVVELKGNVQEMAVAVGKDTGDLADGLYQVISAFGDSADTTEVLRINAIAAAAGLASTTDAINLTSAVTKGYGDTSAQAVQHVADLAFKTVEMGQTTFPELASAMGKVVPIAAELGLSQEELFAVMATGTGVTGTASEVVTQMRGSLQALMAPTADMTRLYESLGFSSGQAMLQQMGYAETMKTITQHAAETGVPLQNFMGSIEGQTLALALSGAQADTYVEKLDAMGDVTGAVDNAFEAQTDGINKAGFAYQQAVVKAQVLAERMGDALAPAFLVVLDAIEPLIDGLGRVVDWFAQAGSGTQIAILAFLGIAAAAGPVLLALAGIAAGLAFLLTPVGLVVAGLALLGAAFAADFLGIRTATVATADAIGKFAGNVAADFATARDEGLDPFRASVFAVQQALNRWNMKGAAEMVGNLGDAAIKARSALSTFATGVSNAFSNTSFPSLESLFNDFKSGDFNALAESIKSTAFDLMVNLDTELNITAKATALRDKLVEAVNSLMTAVGNLDFSAASSSFNQLKNSVQTNLTNALSGIDATPVRTALNGIVRTINTGLSRLSTAAGSFNIGDAISNIRTRMTEVRDGIITSLANVISGTDWSAKASSFSALVTGLAKAIGNIDLSSIDWVSFIKTKLLGPFGPAIKAIEWVLESDALNGLRDAAVDAIKTIDWPELLTAFDSLGTEVKGQIDDVFDDMVSDVTDAINDVDWKQSSLDVSGMMTTWADEVDKIDWTTVGKDTMTAIKDAVAGAFSGESTTFDDLKDAVKGALNAIEWDAISEADSKLSTSVQGAIRDLLSGMFSQLGAEGSMIEFTKPEWLQDLLDWEFEKPDWIQDLIDWEFEKPEWMQSLLDWEFENPEWLQSLIDFELTKPEWIQNLIDFEFENPEWLQGLLDWEWPDLTSLTDWEWPALTDLTDWKWPDLKALTDWAWPDLSALTEWDWPSLAALLEWAWPSLPEWKWPTLPTFAWPVLPTWVWPSLPRFTWPALPRWSWPSIPTPDWLSSLLNALDRIPGIPLFGSQEEEEETRRVVVQSNVGGVQRPLPGADGTATAQWGSQINVYMGGVTIANDMDIEDVAYKIAQRIQRNNRR